MVSILNTLDRISDRDGFYVSGFVDGEGSFYSAVRKATDRPTKWRFTVSFNIANNDKRVLDYCAAVLGCGEVRVRDADSFVFEVADVAILHAQIIPFFTRFPFQSEKKAHELLVFESIVNLFREGQIDSIPRMEEFLRLRNVLNKYRNAQSKYSDKEIRESFRPRPGRN